MRSSSVIAAVALAAASSSFGSGQAMSASRRPSVQSWTFADPTMARRSALSSQQYCTSSAGVGSCGTWEIAAVSAVRQVFTRVASGPETVAVCRLSVAGGSLVRVNRNPSQITVGSHATGVRVTVGDEAAAQPQPQPVLGPVGFDAGDEVQPHPPPEPPPPQPQPPAPVEDPPEQRPEHAPVRVGVRVVTAR